MSNQQPKNACRDCGFELSFFQKQIRRLREKLDHSQLKISSLERECERLRDELKEAKWNGISTIRSRPPPPTFPTEILRAIFGYATSMNGLAFAHWHNRTRKDSWDTTSFTRRSIPLVCRHWYNIGTEFLYKHIVLFTLRQAKALQSALILTSHHSLIRLRIEAIRGVEFLFEASPLREHLPEYLHIAEQILLMLPRDQLRLFSIEEAHHNQESPFLQTVAAIALTLHRNSLETLNLPSTSHTDHWKDIVSTFAFTGDELTLPRLQTLSIANECWWFVSRKGTTEYLAQITFPSLRELSVEWNRSSPLNFLPLIKSVQQSLRTLHVIDYSNNTIHELASILGWLPYLENLSVFFNAQVGGRGPENLITASEKHICLKEVVIWMKTTIGYQSILSIGPLFSIIGLNQLPSLRLIRICGPYPGGCLDRDMIMPPKHAKAWREAIELCKKKRIALVNSSGDPMHIWSMQHGIKWKKQDLQTKPAVATNPNSGSTSNSEPPAAQDEAEAENEDASLSDEETSSEESFSDKHDWFEVETDGALEGSEVSSSAIISDDSEDMPYRYVRQRDIDLVESSSEEDEEF